MRSAGLRNAALFAAMLGAFFLSPHAVLAATIYANYSTGNDTTGDGTSGTPYKTFYKAYTMAAASGDTLNLTGTFDWSNSDETGDASGTGYTLGKSLTIQGQGQTATFIQASSTENTADRGVFTVSSGKTVTIRDVTIRYGVSTATETAGGITNSGTLNVYNSTVSYNRYNSTTNYYGAGGITLKNDANGTVNISTSTIAYNYFNGKYYGSGGMFSGQSNTITVTASTFHNNTASSSNPTTFTYSYAEPSGAIGVFRFVTTTITNSTFTGNTTNAYGGAMQVYYPNSFKVTNCTIANNTADAGAGGILFESVTNGYNLHMKNTIIANNTGGGSANDFYAYDASSAGRVTDNGYNVVEYSTNKTWSATGDVTGNQASMNLDTSLGTNGASNGVQTLALSSGSVAIDAGDSATHSSVAIPTFDQRGGTRSGTTDIGSYEYGAGGITDTTAPSVSLTAPSASATVGGSAVTLSATASDNISVAGVSFFVNGVQQGSEDTTSSYSMSWDSTATSSGSYSAFAVARDTSSNYATSSSVSFTIDNTAPTISSLSASAATTTATITWTTNEAASSQVYFGPSSSYGTSTAESNTSSRVTSHSVALSGLTACSLYHYKASSTDATSNIGTSSDATFETLGCTSFAEITATESSGIATSTGGTVTEGNLTLTVPVAFTATSSTAVFQVNQLDADGYFDSVDAPSGKNRVGSSVFNLKAFSDATTTLSTFIASLTVTLTYSASDVSGVDTATLTIYRYDGTNWSALSGCSTDTSARTVSCSTTQFSDFAIFGDASASSDSSSSSSSSGSGGRQLVQSIPIVHQKNGAIPRPVDPNNPLVPLPPEAQIPPVQTPNGATNIIQGEIKTISTSTTHQFSRTLRPKVTHADVKLLQQFLNVNGFTLARSGAGSPGFENEYFGTRTQLALKKFQEAHAEKILKPLGLTVGTGIFGSATRTFINDMLTAQP